MVRFNLDWLSKFSEFLKKIFGGFFKSDENENKSSSLNSNNNYGSVVKAEKDIKDDLSEVKSSREQKYFFSVLYLLTKSEKNAVINYELVCSGAKVLFHTVFYCSHVLIKQIENNSSGISNLTLGSQIKDIVKSKLEVHNKIVNDTIKSFDALNQSSLRKFFAKFSGDNGWNKRFNDLISRINDISDLSDKSKLKSQRDDLISKLGDDDKKLISELSGLINSKIAVYKKQVEGLDFLKNFLNSGTDEVKKRNASLLKVVNDLHKSKLEIIDLCKKQSGIVSKMMVYDTKLENYGIFFNYLGDEFKNESETLGPSSSVINAFVANPLFSKKIPRSLKHVDLPARKEFAKIYKDYNQINASVVNGIDDLISKLGYDAIVLEKKLEGLKNNASINKDKIESSINAVKDIEEKTNAAKKLIADSNKKISEAYKTSETEKVEINPPNPLAVNPTATKLDLKI